ncbi:MAG: peptide-methionine (S)-S-oxide reductase MsrA [Candidatus Thermoplasmatota archaeon]|nr:peptide-methionine (S)-S-oxide reductase MsrA [Candidatus Thermoplasmatota archaeon]MCL5665526.1 peptide-methionine (S)-S-oxide reductase MsrA [Candidatus Thermoplasmatota archaeon]
MSDKYEIAYLAGGCFWCTEAIFQNVDGVTEVVSGYSGGHLANPTYEDVCTGMTGHAETVKVTYDPEIIKFKEILEIFFHTHDPTTVNRQGADVGPQYRSAIFYTNEEQRNIAREYIRELSASGDFKKPIVTSVEEFTNFYPSEGYHRNYYVKNPDSPYCQYVIAPKVQKFMKKFKPLLKK